jgi:hypothetical protein
MRVTEEIMTWKRVACKHGRKEVRKKRYERETEGRKRVRE